MPVTPNHAVTRHFDSPPDEATLENWLSAQRKRHQGPPTFALLFTSPDCIESAPAIAELIQIYGHVPTVVGCSSNSLIADGCEHEDTTGFAIALYHLPSTQARAVHIPLDDLQSGGDRKALAQRIAGTAPEANAWMLFASPESMSGEAWLSEWDAATGRRVTVGGFAGADPRKQEAAVFLDREVYSNGAVALALEGAVGIEPLVSQACRPIGSPWTVTEASDNIIRKVGNRPILEVLRDTLETMSPRDQKQARGNIFVGLVLDEYKSSFGTGDFLVRNLAAIDPKSGAVAIATPLRIGQNLQFQIRDAQTASVDFEELLKLKLASLRGHYIYGACLCNCIGRGSSLYGVPDHDINLLQEQLPGIAVSGPFCNGEFGPVKGRTRLYGYAASLALFARRAGQQPGG